MLRDSLVTYENFKETSNEQDPSQRGPTSLDVLCDRGKEPRNFLALRCFVQMHLF